MTVGNASRVMELRPRIHGGKTWSQYVPWRPVAEGDPRFREQALKTGSVQCELAALLTVSVVASHAPGKIRYFVPFGGRGIQGADTKG